MSTGQPSVKPVYAVFGDESFLKRQAVGRVVALALEGDPDSMGPTRIDGDTAELADALDELQTLSLLGGRRIVIVEDADGFITRYRKRLEQYCADPATGATLILLCRSLPRNTNLYKLIANRGEVIPCAAPRGAQLAPWINRRAHEAYAKGIEPQAVAELRDLVGSSLEALDNELAKLAVYVGARKRITADDVEALVGLHREETVFRVTDAMSAGNAASALEAWQHALATDRAAPDRAIGGLAWAIRRLLEAKQAVAAGVPPESLAGRFRQNTDAFIRRLNSTTIERLEAQLADLHQADLDTKTGLGDVETAIEAFIVKHTVPRKEPARTPVGGY